MSEDFDPIENYRGRLHEAVITRDALQELMHSDGWKVFCEYCAEQLQARRNAYELTPLKSILEIGEQEFAKGEAATFRAVQEVPEMLLTIAQETINLITSELNDEEKADVENSTTYE